MIECNGMKTSCEEVLNALSITAKYIVPDTTLANLWDSYFYRITIQSLAA